MTQLQAVALSLAIEVPLVVLASRIGPRAPLSRVAWVALAATLVTHPIVWHGVPGLRGLVGPWWARVAILEVFAWGAEAGIFAWQLGWRLPRALAASACANGASFAFGLWWTWPSAACPPGLGADAARSAQLAATLGHDPGALCFGAVRERGLRDDAGRLLLDAGTDDRLLAARIVHLERHARAPRPGGECLEALRAEEAEGWAAELAVRRRLAVEDPACPVAAALGPSATAEAIDRWLATAESPLAAELRASHERRCAR